MERAARAAGRDAGRGDRRDRAALNPDDTLGSSTGPWCRPMPRAGGPAHCGEIRCSKEHSRRWRSRSCLDCWAARARPARSDSKRVRCPASCTSKTAIAGRSKRPSTLAAPMTAPALLSRLVDVCFAVTCQESGGVPIRLRGSRPLALRGAGRAQRCAGRGRPPAEAVARDPPGHPFARLPAPPPRTARRRRGGHRPRATGRCSSRSTASARFAIWCSTPAAPSSMCATRCSSSSRVARSESSSRPTRRPPRRPHRRPRPRPPRPRPTRPSLLRLLLRRRPNPRRSESPRPEAAPTAAAPTAPPPRPPEPEPRQPAPAPAAASAPAESTPAPTPAATPDPGSGCAGADRNSDEPEPVPVPAQAQEPQEAEASEGADAPDKGAFLRLFSGLRDG